MNKIEDKMREVRSIDVNDFDRCYEIWKPLGMLDGLENVEIEKKVASEFTKMAKYLLFVDGAYMNSINVCAFPTVRRIFGGGKSVNDGYSPKAVCEHLQQALKEVSNAQAQKDLGIDIEAEACSVVSDMFIQTNKTII